MNKKSFLIFGAILILIALAVSYSLSIAKQPPQEVTPENAVTTTMIETETPLPMETATLQPGIVATIDPHPTLELIFENGLPNTSEAQDVIRAVYISRYIEMEAGRTLDPSEFSTVFINDPRFPLNLPTLDVVRRVTHNPSIESAGWLDYKVAMVNFDREQQMRPKVANVVPTSTYSPTETVPPGEIRYLAAPPPPLIFKSISIENDIAKVVLNEGYRTYELTLVLIDGKWYIAAYKGMGVSP